MKIDMPLNKETKQKQDIIKIKLLFKLLDMVICFNLKHQKNQLSQMFHMQTIRLDIVEIPVVKVFATKRC